eukprot:3323694-Amphidinium_carterae.1
MSEYGQDELFFGSYRVHMAAASGEVLSFTFADWDVDMSDEALVLTLNRNSPLRCEHAAVADVVVPCIPARELVRSTSADASARATDLSKWPDGLRQPLMKVKDATSTEPKAVASGCRSALVK